MPSLSIPVVSEKDARQALSVAEGIAAIEECYRDYGRHRDVLSTPPAMFTPKAEGIAEFKIKGARAPSAGAMGFRIIADRHTSTGEESMDFCWVADAATGEIIGIVNETSLHRFRTAATGVVAAKWLARPDVKSIAIVGTGRIADELPALIAQVYKSADVRVAARSLASAEAFATRHRAALKMQPKATVDEAVDGVDLVIAITASTSPVIEARHLKKGMTVVGLGGGAEIAADVLTACTSFVIDDLSYAWMIGSVASWIEAGLTRDAIEGKLTADIGEVALGKSARSGPDDIVLAIIQGMASCDVALAHAVLEKSGKRALAKSA